MKADREKLLAHLHATLDFRPLSGAWAKVEILLGLFSAGTGILVGSWLVNQPIGELEWGRASLALLLFVLGGYLTLAGQRSHLYQSANSLAAFIVQETGRPGNSGSPVSVLSEEKEQTFLGDHQ
jgi:hypothetical protein